MLNAALRMNQAFNPVEVREREPILAMTVNGNEITTLLNSNNLKKQKINSNTLISQTNLKTVAGTKNTAYLNSDGSKVVIGFDNNTLANFDSKNNFEPVVSQGHDGLIRSVAFCNDGITTISGGRDSAFIIWKQNKLYKKVKCASRVRAIALGTDNTIYVGCENGMVYQSEIDGSNLKYFASGKGRVQSISCSGKWICIGYSDGQLQVANARGQIIRTQFETAAVDFIAADESSDLLITGLSSKKVHIFRVSEGGKPIEINCDQVITGVELNGDFIFVSCADNTILSYPVKSGYFEPLLSKNLTRKLTLEEWQTYIGRDVPYEK
jgi:WD40 repeat protein